MGQVIPLPRQESTKEYPFVQLTKKILEERGYGKNARHKSGEMINAPEENALETLMSQ